ncbi:peptidoglycan-recognition protein LC-like isoform X1 [Galleria mellonella]|uniref:Peptidoglycan recognition protein n=1 Tax=Galleria mellonella TaxID=7137 RepID=A0A6J1WS27_GALME|nr:peptidoglycan-recognition protein LC-like isoform X1 [Galleria mellonella]
MAVNPNLIKEDNSNNSSVKLEEDLDELQISTVNDNDIDDGALDKRVSSKTTELAKFSAVGQRSYAPVFGSVAVSNSENVQFGDTTHFHGPVTIIHNNNGVENVSYMHSEDENLPEREKYSTTTKCDESVVKKFYVHSWVKVVVSAVCVILIAVTCALALLVQGNKNSSNETVSDMEADTPYYTRVVGVCHDNFQLIMFTIMVPLTIILMLYSLLTPQTLDFDKKRKFHSTISTIEEFENRMTKNAKRKADTLLIAPNHLRIVSRTDWLAQPVENELDKIRQPVPWVIITHTATESCHSQSECVLRVRLIQMFHIESRNWDDIGYNFLVAGDGSAYYGRGWDYIGAHTLGYNRYSIAIAFIGTFNNEAPPKKQIEACEKLIKLGVHLGKLSKDYKLFAHRQLASTLSPGDKLFDIIKTWPHFVKDASNISELIPSY